MGQSPTLKQRRRDRVRDALEAAAVRLFTSQGFDGTTVADIADAVDMSPRNFFRYFPSKEDVVFAKSPFYLSVLRGYVRTRPRDESDYAALKEALIAFGSLLQETAGRALVAIRLIAASPALAARRAKETERWCRDLEQELAARPGGRRSQVLMRLTVSVAFAAFVTAMDEWSTSSGRPSLPSLVRRSFAMLERDIFARYG